MDLLTPGDLEYFFYSHVSEQKQSDKKKMQINIFISEPNKKAIIHAFFG